MSSEDYIVDINDLAIQVGQVLAEHDIRSNPASLYRFLNRWKEAKQDLLNFLSQHPNWNHESLAILDTHTVVYSDDMRLSIAEEFVNYIQENEGSSYKQSVWSPLTELVAGCPSTDISARWALSLNENKNLPCKAAAGQKISRYINAVCEKLGVNTYPDYNRKFASFSGQLNAEKVTNNTVLSVHPADYFRLSYGSWTSCLDIGCKERGAGCYCSGVLSYIMDSTTMVFYSTNGTTSPHYKHRKMLRQLFSLEGTTLLQSRLYPAKETQAKYLSNTFRRMVQDYISCILKVPSRWVVTFQHDRVNSYVTSVYGSHHYADYYENSNCGANVSWLKANPRTVIQVGDVPRCIDCEEIVPNSRRNMVSCCSCVKRNCDMCSAIYYSDLLHRLDGSEVCDNCVDHCSNCNKVCLKTRYYVRISGTKEKKLLCADCANSSTGITIPCVKCGECWDNDYRVTISGQEYCRDCLQAHFVRCASCEKYINNAQGTLTHRSQHYCLACFIRATINLNTVMAPCDLV